MLTVLWEDVAECPDIATLLERLFNTACAATDTAVSVEITVLLAGDARLRELNRTYRGIDAPTDVLSFAQRDALPVDAEPAPYSIRGCKTCPEPVEGPALPPEERAYLGDIAISWERVRAQAAAYGHSEERELAYLFVHGFLHLRGYTHAENTAYTQMRTQEEAILNQAGLPRSVSAT
ncbi:MAG: rRNA maturation RNase YbeY [Chloroflexi bacterium]|nr:rRNA maturation RNase YbeY [Chloroflexota bacterium]